MQKTVLILLVTIASFSAYGMDHTQTTQDTAQAQAPIALADQSQVDNEYEQADNDSAFFDHSNGSPVLIHSNTYYPGTQEYNQYNDAP